MAATLPLSPTCPCRRYCLTLTKLLGDAPIEGAAIELYSGYYADFTNQGVVTGDLLATGETDDHGRWCIDRRPAGTRGVRITIPTEHGPVAAAFPVDDGSPCGTEVEYVACYGSHTVIVSDATSGEPLTGLIEDGGGSWPIGAIPFTEDSPGVYRARYSKIKPKGDEFPLGTLYFSFSRPCYYNHLYTSLNPDGTTREDPTAERPWTCGDTQEWVALVRKQFTLRVKLAPQCGGVFQVAVGDEPPVVHTVTEYEETKTVDVPLSWPFSSLYPVKVTPVSLGFVTPSPIVATLNCAAMGLDYPSNNSNTPQPPIIIGLPSEYVVGGIGISLDGSMICSCCGRELLPKTLHLSNNKGSCELTWAVENGDEGWYGAISFDSDYAQDTSREGCYKGPRRGITVFYRVTCSWGSDEYGDRVSVWIAQNGYSVCPGPLYVDCFSFHDASQHAIGSVKRECSGSVNFAVDMVPHNDSGLDIDAPELTPDSVTVTE